MKNETLSSYIILLLVLAFTLVIVKPWADIPLNDDWQYARVAKHLAENDALRLDVPIAPTLIGQVLAVYPFVRFFGFSHTLLRILTFICALAVLILIERILALAGVKASRRLWIVIGVLFNPLFIYLSLTFMTEIWGLLPPMLAAYLWFRERNRLCNEAHETRSLVFCSWTTIVLVAVLSGLSFWIRQLGVLVFPAILSASIIVLLVEKQHPLLKRSLPRFVAGSLLCALVVLAYFPFAQSESMLRPEFSRPLSQVFEPDMLNAIFYVGMFFFYATFCLFPLLPPLRLTKSNWKKTLFCSAPIAALCIIGIMVAQDKGQPAMISPVHAGFPFVNNLLYNIGIGPITLTDVYIHNLSHPKWPDVLFDIFQWLLVGLTVFWGASFWKFKPFFTAEGKMRQPAREIAVFGLIFAAVTLLIVIQCFKWAVFDRYFFNTLVAFAIPIGILLENESPPRKHDQGPVVKGQRVLSGVWLCGLILFTTFGLHDYFRWNEVRWDLYQEMRAGGISATVIQAGYEVNGWENYDSFVSGQAPTGCIGGCSRRVFGWYSLDDSYRVGMNVLGDYIPIKAVKPGYLLADGPPIVVSRRPGF